MRLVLTCHKVNGAATAEDVSTRDHSTTAIEPLRGSRVVESSSLGVELRYYQLQLLGFGHVLLYLHVSRVNSRTVDPVLVSLDLIPLTKVPQTYHGLLILSSPASINKTWRLWSRLASLPAGTQPELPPPQTMISTSSGTVMLAVFQLALLDGSGEDQVDIANSTSERALV